MVETVEGALAVKAEVDVTKLENVAIVEVAPVAGEVEPLVKLSI